MHSNWHMLVFVTALLTSGAAHAQPVSSFNLIEHFAKTLLPGMTLGAFLEVRRTEFRQLDVDRDDAVSPADRVLQLQENDAVQRAGHMALMLRADLDGDGVLR